MTAVVRESQMEFGPYDKTLFFYIEKCPTLKELDGVAVPEFLLLREEKGLVYLVEAKSSSPNPTNGEDFDKFISDISRKWIEGLSLYISIAIDQHGEKDHIPDKLKKLSDLNFCFVLIIRGHKEEWLDPLKQEFSNRLRVTLKLWGLKPPAIIVLNEDLASRTFKCKVVK